MAQELALDLRYCCYRLQWAKIMTAIIKLTICLNIVGWLSRSLSLETTMLRPMMSTLCEVYWIRGLSESYASQSIPNPIRIAYIGQAAMISRLKNLVNELEQKHQPKERPNFDRISRFQPHF